MNDTLKVAGRIGAELGAAKAENEKLREVLRCIADLPMDRCSTENDYRLSAAKAIALGALSQQAEPADTYTAVDMATAAAQGFRDGQAAVEPAPAQDGQSPTGLSRTREQWAKVDAKICAKSSSPAANYYLIRDAQRDIEKLHVALATRPAQTATQTEQSGLVEAAGAVIRAADWWSANEDSPKSALAHFARATDALRAALSAQGESHE